MENLLSQTWSLIVHHMSMCVCISKLADKNVVIFKVDNFQSRPQIILHKKVFVIIKIIKDASQEKFT